MLGKGSFGKVKRFIDKNSLKRFAGKIFKKQLIDKKGPNVRNQIYKEISLSLKLKHKNAIKIFDYYSTDHKVYVFMKYCFGVLQEILNSVPLRKLSKSQSHNYFCQLIEGLEYLHSKGIIHRDIKLDNILITNSDIIKIADFEASYKLNPFAVNDMTYGLKGTGHYQPPELFNKSISEYSGSKFDIWSSGVILYNMISGEFPIYNTHKFILTDSVLINEVKYPEEIANDLQLLDLLKIIFNNNFMERISINEIKNHAWFVMNHNKDEEYVPLPKGSYGDIYIGMTVFKRIEVYYYPNDENNSSQKSKDPRKTSPNIRCNRLQSSRSHKINYTPIQRLIRLELHRR